MASRGEAKGGTLIVGGGFAGAYVARLLRKRGATIVSPDNFMLLTPLLPEAASGTIEPRHAVVPLRLMCPYAELLLGHATELDTERRVVRVETEDRVFAIGYAQLVLAVGSISRVPPIPGLADHGLGFKDLADAIHLRNHVLRRLEAAAAAANETHRRRELTFVFVGAGYAGVEALGELADLVRDALRHYPSLRGEPTRWVLVDAAPKILPEIPTRLGDYAAAQLARRGVEIKVETTLERLDPHAATLSNRERILTSTLVWTAGIRPSPVLVDFGLPLDERGRVRVDQTLRVEGHDTVWALGDGARVPNEATPGRPDPPTSQHALARHGVWRRTSEGIRRDIAELGLLGHPRGLRDD
jgi:NADH dehydrogenase